MERERCKVLYDLTSHMHGYLKPVAYVISASWFNYDQACTIQRLELPAGNTRDSPGFPNSKRLQQINDFPCIGKEAKQ